MKTTRPAILSAPSWRAALKSQQVAGLSRAAPIERAKDGTVSFIASTAGADRYGDTIDQAGWDTASYEKNPVLLWAHSYSTPPVGKVGKLDKASDLTARDVEWTTEAQHPFGAQVGEMVKAGFLNTVSVGFLPLEWEERFSDKGVFLGYHFKRQELLEISVVPVPANPQALVEGRAFAKSVAAWADGLGETAEPIAREFRERLVTLLKSAEDQAQRVEERSDEDAFAEMLAVMKSIDSRLEVLTRQAPALVRSPPLVDAPKSLTISEALASLLKR